jgi:hypothetical protein
VTNADNQVRTSSRGRWPIFILVAIITIAVVIGIYWFITQGPGQQILSPAGSTVAEFNGEADQRTSSFDVREGWAINWEASGERFAFAIRGDRDFGTVIDVDEPGSGVTSPTGAGTFYLEITAEGPWSVRIAQGE